MAAEFMEVYDEAQFIGTVYRFAVGPGYHWTARFFGGNMGTFQTYEEAVEWLQTLARERVKYKPIVYPQPEEDELEEEPECPITMQSLLMAMLEGKFEPFREVDYDGFTGVEGQGFIWYEESFFVICDRKVDAEQNGNDYWMTFNIVQETEEISHTWTTTIVVPDPELLF